MTRPIDDAETVRSGAAALLADALADARDRLLRLWDAYAGALAAGGFEVRYKPELNPPLWELGHIGWFEDWWIARNPARLAGHRADPAVARAPSTLPRADEFYDSGRVAHTTRWNLPLPDARRTLQYVDQVRRRTLALLREAPHDDAELYFFRLALVHEDMHREAWIYMAQTLGIPLGAAIESHAPAAAGIDGTWSLPAQCWRLGRDGGGFAFDNELQLHHVDVGAFEIDRAPVTWGRYLPFIESGGYDDRRLWSDDGWAWRQRDSNGRPRHLTHDDGRWQRAQFGRWVDVDPEAPASHLSAHEAHAWCAWAGRRLPNEAEWECAAVSAAAGGEPFAWGQVWEWTATPFAPYPGFEPHPYRDYSAAWFDGRPVLRGGSFATAPRMKHPRYRNFFPPQRNDIIAGFRSCAV